VVRELKWTKSADVYSFGVLAFEVVSGGQFPFNSLSDEALITLMTSSSVPSGSLFKTTTLRPPALYVVFFHLLPSLIFSGNLIREGVVIPLIDAAPESRPTFDSISSALRALF